MAHLESLALRQVFVKHEGKDTMPKERFLWFSRHVVGDTKALSAYVNGCQAVGMKW